MNPQIKWLMGLQPHLHSKIKGQDHAISRVCSVLECDQLGLQPAGKPLGSLLFLGPTGVAKTELKLEFSRYLFGGESAFRFDCPEFLHLDNVKLFMGDKTAKYFIAQWEPSRYTFFNMSNGIIAAEREHVQPIVRIASSNALHLML